MSWLFVDTSEASNSKVKKLAEREGFDLRFANPFGARAANVHWTLSFEFTIT
jgi:hypothetical protein